MTVRLLAPADASADAVSENTVVIVLVLFAFLICALAFALTAARSLQSQISRLLEAARKLGKGDFSVAVPTEGNDEFAELGREFNDMARELESRLEELGLERARLQETVRRVGESLGKGLDRDALLGIVVEAALDGVDADCGRVMMRHSANGKLFEAARGGRRGRRHIAACRRPSRPHWSWARRPRCRSPARSRWPGPSGARSGRRRARRVLDRAPAPAFTERQRELFGYLTNQAVISIENVGLHETIQRQAITDELTGLFNHRHFQEVMANEVERARRFDQELGLVMFDIDDFKQVNDTTAICRAIACSGGRAASCASPRARSTSPRATAGRRWPWRCRRRACKGPTSSPSACATGSRRSISRSSRATASCA